MVFTFDIVYPTPELQNDVITASRIAQQDVIIRRADPQPGDADLEVSAFEADTAEYDRLLALPGPSDSLPLNRVRIVKIGPTELRATLFYSNNGFFNLGTIDPTQAGNSTGAFDATTRTENFDVPVLVTEQLIAPNSADIITNEVYESFNLPADITVWRIRVTHPTYTIDDLNAISAQQGAFHLIQGNVYRFRGATSVRAIQFDNQGSPNDFAYTYEWEVDPGSREREIEPGSALDLTDISDIAVFEDPVMPLTISARTFSGRWWRPPYSRLLPVAKDATFFNPFGADVDISVRRVVPFWDGMLDQAAGWVNLPGDPVGSLG